MGAVMASSDTLAAVPPRPPGIAEWEDLLVRFEIAPRIAATVLEEIPPERWEHPLAPAGWSPCNHLAHLGEREQTLNGWIDALRQGEAVPAARETPMPGDAPAHLARFARLRGRNSGAVQRRGVEVWEWAAPTPGGGVVTLYQVLALAVRHDGRHISAMRAAC